MMRSWMATLDLHAVCCDTTCSHSATALSALWRGLRSLLFIYWSVLCSHWAARQAGEIWHVFPWPISNACIFMSSMWLKGMMVPYLWQGGQGIIRWCRKADWTTCRSKKHWWKDCLFFGNNIINSPRMRKKSCNYKGWSKPAWTWIELLCLPTSLTLALHSSDSVYMCQ